jgi:hypothetical protein
LNAPTAWAAALPLDDALYAAALRLEPGIQSCTTATELWLRGERLDESLTHRLRLLPGARRYIVWEDGQLQLQGALTPHGYLPAGPWQPLSQQLELQLPLIGRPGVSPAKTLLNMVRCAVVAEPMLLITSWDEFQPYAEIAPQLRLHCLVMALASDNRVALFGSPLPPLKGQRFVVRDGVAAPAGWTWSPAVDPDVVRELLGIEARDLALLHIDGNWEHIPASSLVRVTRSAVRNTSEALHAG